MSNQPHIRRDLTRWNRAGLKRFDYVDGDAAAWLEELRLSLIGLYMRGEGDMDERGADAWRDLFLDETDPARREGRDLPALLDAVDWARVAPPPPGALETRGQRRTRLLGQYNTPPDGDHAWEILRSFARASHVLTGHLDAYTREGYLRTATQWDNLRRLAALVNYQPTPPASSSMLVALGLKPGLGPTEVGAGLALKHAPETGAPLIFETRTPLSAHPALNAARPEFWGVNDVEVRLTDPVRWIWPEDTELVPGDIVVFADGLQGVAAILAGITPQDAPERATIAVTMPAGVTSPALETGRALLFTQTEDVRAGLPRPRTGQYKLKIHGTKVGLQQGDLIRLVSRGLSEVVEVTRAQGETIWVQTDADLPGKVEIWPMSPVGRDLDGRYKTGDVGLFKMYYTGATGIRSKARGDSGVETLKTEDDAEIGFAFDLSGMAGVSGYVDRSDAEPVMATVEDFASTLADGESLRKVMFEGKPPKALAGGSWVVERDAAGALTALRVTSIRTATGRYELTFHAEASDAPELSEYHGPMKAPLRPEGYDRNPHIALPGALQALTLVDVPAEAASILRPGRPLILCAEDRGCPDVPAVLTSLNHVDGDRLEITFKPDGETGDFVTGQLLVRLNAVTATHGESKGPKTLGSGDGEFAEQAFTLKVPGISHVPSTLASCGVIPDIVVTVDDEAWDYRDYTDPTADGTRSWSPVLGEDGLLRLHFRRRLPTGTNNVRLRSHRIGTGARGNDVPPLAIAKPMRKHPSVETLHQPFAASGGADREPVESLRASAPARLQANGRAVSLADFEKLVQGHASVWRARAVERGGAGRSRGVRITLVPAGGGQLETTLKTDLSALLSRYALPGVSFGFADFGPVRLVLGASIRADLVSHDRTDILAAAQDKLARTFALEARDFGQPVYVAEVLAALETVPGIVTATMTDFDTEPPRPNEAEAPMRTASRDGKIAAIFPEARQVAFLGPVRTGAPQANLKLTVEDADG